MIKIHFLVHVPFEEPAYIEEWALGRGHKLSSTMFYKNYKLPEINEYDWLIIMGGPMSVNEEDKYPWLKNEKQFIKDAIDNAKVVIGICLGAQLIADVLGAKVYKNAYKEIGWFPVHFTNTARKLNLFSSLPEEIMVFHWHGETFEIPDGAIHLAKSEGCVNQAFIFNNKVLAFQFHFEMTEDAILELTKEGNVELIPAKYIQNGGEIIGRREYISNANSYLKIILDNLENIIE